MREKLNGQPLLHQNPASGGETTLFTGFVHEKVGLGGI